MENGWSIVTPLHRATDLILQVLLIGINLSYITPRWTACDTSYPRPSGCHLEKYVDCFVSSNCSAYPWISTSTNFIKSLKLPCRQMMCKEAPLRSCWRVRPHDDLGTRLMAHQMWEDRAGLEVNQWKTNHLVSAGKTDKDLKTHTLTKTMKTHCKNLVSDLSLILLHPWGYRLQVASKSLECWPPS